jgi:hypothetical protein
MLQHHELTRSWPPCGEQISTAWHRCLSPSATIAGQGFWFPLLTCALATNVQVIKVCSAGFDEGLPEQQHRYSQYALERHW